MSHVATSIRSISECSGDKFSVRYQDGDAEIVPFNGLPFDIDDDESPEQYCDSDEFCPICNAALTRCFVYVWPCSRKGGRIVMFDRTHYFERTERVECHDCFNFRTFQWEHCNPDRIKVPFYLFGNYYVRYYNRLATSTKFAINDREGIATE